MATGQDFDVDIRPDSGALRMFRSLSFTPWYALGEFVDNSISSYFAERGRLESAYGSGFELHIDIQFDSDAARLTVSDNAAGIARTDIPRALHTGEPPPDNGVGLNVHGVGMKAAAFWWGQRLRIDTQPLGEPQGWEVEIDIGRERGHPPGSVRVRRVPPRTTSGTTITVDGLWQNAPVARTTRAKIAAYLPSIYRRFISVADRESLLPAVHIFVDGQRLEFEPPELLTAPFWPSTEGPARGAAPRLWRTPLSFELSTGKTVSGWVGILDTMSRDLSGFVLHYRGKGVGGVTPVGERREDNSGFKPREIFGQAGSYRSQSYIGEFDVTDFGKSITTDSTLWTPDEEEEFVTRVLEAMKAETLDMWSMAVNYKRRRRAALDEAALHRVSRLITAELKKAATGVVSHDRPNDLVPAEVPATEQDDVRFVITDREVHQHSFALRYTTERVKPLVELIEDRTSRNHLVIVNEGHPVFDDLPPIDKNTRTLLTRLVLALASAEVFTPSPDRRLVRAKMNEILSLVHPVPDDLEEVG